MTVIALGGVACALSVYFLPLSRLDFRFLVLAGLTLAIGSRCSLQIPGVSSHISVSDTFIFLTIILFGGEAATLIAFLDGLFTSLRFSRRPQILIFNSAAVALSTFATAEVLHWVVGDTRTLTSAGYTPAFATAIIVMACAQYIFNTGLVAGIDVIKSGQPFLTTWRQNYLWTSVTYFAGASAAGLIVKLIEFAGFYAFLGSLPVIGIVYFTYTTYLKHVETSAAQAKQAERHVEELSHYIEEQERIREQLMQVEKLSALGELASGVAHDFNNTLAGILGRAQLLTRTSDPEKIRKGLQIIIKTAEDGAKTVKRIQDFARQRRGHDFEPVAVDQLLLDVREITRPRWKDSAEAIGVNIHFQVEIYSNVLVLGNESELREVLVNLVLNAVDAMPEGGKLILLAREVDGQVELSIRDTGIGMSPEIRSRIFDPFFTTKGKAGYGLGLAVSYGIISRHNGTIEVESTVGTGTIFRIKLPQAKIAPQDAREGVVVTTPVEVKNAARARILVVDDEPSVLELIRDILEAGGFEVVQAANGYDALALLRHQQFDGMFTDIGMPGMSGWELIQAIRERKNELPIAVITGWGEVVDTNKLKAAHVNAFVTKPFTMEGLIELASEISRQGQRTNEDLHVQQQSGEPGWGVLGLRPLQTEKLSTAAVSDGGATVNSKERRERDDSNGVVGVQLVPSAGGGFPAIRILIIDDDLSILATYQELLEGKGYRIATASSGSQAMEISKEFCPDILLLDYNMPDMNGLQLLENLRAVTPDALPIIITGYDDRTIMKGAIQQSVYDYLFKPISIIELEQTIQRAVNDRASRERERRLKDLLSIVSHELRTPLQAPLRFIENILSDDQNQLTEEQKYSLQRALKGIKTEISIVTNMLNYQYLESERFYVRLTQTTLQSVVQEAVDSFQLQAKDKQVKLVWDAPSEPFIVLIDPEQIKQAIGNILNNALEHSPSGKSVKIRLFRYRNEVRCLIRDFGPGIPSPYVKRIFEKMFQVPSDIPKKGLGIGLYITRAIIRTHGGNVIVRSKLGKGSIFIITLPNP